MNQLAIGKPDIVRDEMTFRYKSEIFTFPVLVVWKLVKWNPDSGYYADARKLRALAKEKH